MNAFGRNVMVMVFTVLELELAHNMDDGVRVHRDMSRFHEVLQPFGQQRQLFLDAVDRIYRLTQSRWIGIGRCRCGRRHRFQRHGNQLNDAFFEKALDRR